jgi:hypothetical protein
MHPQRLNEFPSGYRDTLTRFRVNLIVNGCRSPAAIKHRLPKPVQPTKLRHLIGRRVGNSVNSLRSLIAHHTTEQQIVPRRIVDRYAIAAQLPAKLPLERIDISPQNLVTPKQFFHGWQPFSP